MNGEIPWQIAVPLALIAWAAFLYVRRRDIAAWLGFRKGRDRD